MCDYQIISVIGWLELWKQQLVVWIFHHKRFKERLPSEEEKWNVYPAWISARIQTELVNKMQRILHLVEPTTGEFFHITDELPVC